MGRYRAVWKDGKLLAEYENGELIFLAETYQAPQRSDYPTPHIVKDIGAYRSPIDGSLITSRSQHRDHLKAHDLIEVGNERMPASPTVSPRRELGEALKRRVEEVRALPQAVYDEQVKRQAHEHAEIAASVGATSDTSAATLA